MLDVLQCGSMSGVYYILVVYSGQSSLDMPRRRIFPTNGSSISSGLFNCMLMVIVLPISSNHRHAVELVP